MTWGLLAEMAEDIVRQGVAVRRATINACEQSGILQPALGPLTRLAVSTMR